MADPDVPARVEVPVEANQRQPALQPQRIQLNLAGRIYKSGSA
jgi:hypothetical protein